MHCRHLCEQRKHRGQSLVEFALVLPFLLLLIVAVVEFGRIVVTKSVLTAAAREGVRVAVVTEPDDELVRERVRAVLSSIGQEEHIEAIDVVGPEGDPPEQTVAVRVNLRYSLRFVGLIPGLPEETELESEAVMRFES